MAAIILVAFLALVAILGGWWLKGEKGRQRKELIRQGGIASGKLDDALLPKQKPPKRKRKKREANWFDPKYVPPEMPGKETLKIWVAQAAKVIDELMPMVHAYRRNAAAAATVNDALKTATNAVPGFYPHSAVTAEAALDWYETMEDRVSARNAAQKAADIATAELAGQFKPVSQKVMELRGLVGQANSWELYKAPEAFHEKLEIASLLLEEIGSEFDFNNTPRPSGQEKPIPWRRRRNWARWNEPEEVDQSHDGIIVAATRQMMLEALPHVAALQAALDEGHQAQKDWTVASKPITLARPVKPDENEVEALIGEVLNWSRGRGRAHNKGARAAIAVRQALSRATDVMTDLVKAVELLADADVPDSDMATKDALKKAVECITAHQNNCTSSLGTLLSLQDAPKGTAEELHAEQESAARLRNLMRKLAFAVAQLDAAKRSVEAAQADKPQLGDVIPPVLTQSSAAAFVNAFGRMTEINGRNEQKKSAHDARVRQVKGQCTERQEQKNQALKALHSAVASGDSGKYAADMAIMQPAAELFADAYKKDDK